MKKLFGNLLMILTFFAIPCVAQPVQARKIDEFNQRYYGDALARMDFLAVTLAEQPGAKAYIIVYSGAKDGPGSSYRYANRLKNYLKYRRIDEKRVVAIGAGQQENQSTELWLVPEGANPPEQTAFFSAEQISAGQPTKFDQYTIKLPQEGGWDVWDGSYEDEPARLTRLAEVLRQRKDLRLYIVARSQAVYGYKPVGKKLRNGTRNYVAFRSRKLSDPAGFDLKLATAEKRYLIKELCVEASRIAAVGDGFSLPEGFEMKITSDEQLSAWRSYMGRTVELWLVPGSSSKLVLKNILQNPIK